MDKRIVDGKWGSKTTYALQIALGTPADGIISNQLHNDVTAAIYGGITDGTRPKDPVTREEVWTMLYRVTNGSRNQVKNPESRWKMLQ